MKPYSTFELYLQLNQGNILYSVENRGFTLQELKRALLAACGNRLTSAYLDCWDLEVWELVELLEMLVDAQPKTEVDIEDIL